jgi:hypothetical protein
MKSARIPESAQKAESVHVYVRSRRKEYQVAQNVQKPQNVQKLQNVNLPQNVIFPQTAQMPLTKVMVD